MRLVFSAQTNIPETLYRALREPFGLKIAFDDVPLKTARQWFYVEMRKRDPEFESLRLVNIDNQLWIVRRDAQVPRASDPPHDPSNRGSL